MALAFERKGDGRQHVGLEQPTRSDRVWEESWETGRLVLDRLGWETGRERG